MARATKKQGIAQFTPRFAGDTLEAQVEWARSIGKSSSNMTKGITSKKNKIAAKKGKSSGRSGG